jgi:inorganic pyrophosphatase
MNTLGEAYKSSGVLEAPSMKVFIQNEAGSFVKNFYDEKTLTFTGTARVSRAYPLPYGFILNTTSDDGLNVDCFVLTKTSLHTGQIVECDPAGLMEQLEDGKEDHNVLAVIRGEEERLDSKTKQELVEFVSHVFDHVAGKTVLAGNFRGRESAIDYIRQHKDPGRTAAGATA